MKPMVTLIVQRDDQPVMRALLADIESGLLVSPAAREKTHQRERTSKSSHQASNGLFQLWGLPGW